jgi:hypothetical protein
MFAVFQRHRLLKILSLVLAVIVLSYVGHGVASFYQGRSAGIDDLVGYYAYGVSHQIDIKNDHLGRLVSGGTSFSFAFDYSDGTFFCHSAEGADSWRMKSLSGSEIYSEYDKTLLYRQEVAE